MGLNLEINKRMGLASYTNASSKKNVNWMKAKLPIMAKSHMVHKSVDRNETQSDLYLSMIYYCIKNQPSVFNQNEKCPDNKIAQYGCCSVIKAVN